MSVITKVRYIWGSDKLCFNITFKFMPLKLRLSSVLLHMDMNNYILYIQKHALLHSWTLDVTDGSTTHQDSWILPSFTHLLYCTTYSKFLSHPPSQWRNSPLWARAPSLPWLHDHTQMHHTLVVLLSTSDRPDAKTPMWQHSQDTDIHAPSGIWTHHPSKQTAADPHLTPRSH
jgi:hypothetical protein